MEDILKGKNAADLLTENDKQETIVIKEEEEDFIEDDDKSSVPVGFDNAESPKAPKGKKRQLAEHSICDFERSFFVKRVAPDIPYEFLVYVSFKNAKFAALPYAQVCSFIEQVFEYFSGREPSWHEAVISCLNNNTSFIKTPGKSVAMSSYIVNYRKKREIDQAIEEWRKNINDDNVHIHGFTSLEEFRSVFDGEHGLFFEYPEAYRQERAEIKMKPVKRDRIEEPVRQETELTPEAKLQYIKFNQPSIPYKFLTFTAFKNAGFISLQLQQICNFLGTVFLYYSRNRSAWRNKVMASVYNNHTFLKLPNRTNSRFSYSVNPYKTKEIEEKIEVWRKNVNEENVYTFGFETLEAFDSVFNGEHSLFFENSEAYCRQWGLEPPEQEEDEDGASPKEDSIDDSIDAVLKKMSGGKSKTKKKEEAVMKAVEAILPLPAINQADDRFSYPNDASDPFHAVAVSAAQDVMFSRVHDGVRPVTDEELEMFDFLDTGEIAQQVNEYLQLTGFSVRSFAKDALNRCTNLTMLLNRPAHWDNCSRSVKMYYIQMKLFLEDVEQAIQESKEAVLQEEGQNMDNPLPQMNGAVAEGQMEPELGLIKDEPGTSSSATYTMVPSGNEETLVTFDGLSEENGNDEDSVKDYLWRSMQGRGPSTSKAPQVNQQQDNNEEKMEFWPVMNIQNLQNVFEVSTTLPEDIHVAVCLQKAGILPSQLYCKCARAMSLVGRSMPLWVCPSCTHLISVTENSFFKTPKIALRQIWIILLAWIQDATVDFVVTTFNIPKHVVLHYYSSFRRLCDRIADRYPQFGGKGCTVHVDSCMMLNRVRVISGIDSENGKCFATIWGSANDIPFAVRRHVKTGSTLLVTDWEPDWGSQFSNVRETNTRSPVIPVLQKVEATMKEMGAPPQDHVLRGYVSEIVVRYCEGSNLYAKMIQTLREFIPDKLRVPHRLSPAGILLPEDGNSKGMKVVYDPSRY